MSEHIYEIISEYAGGLNGKGRIQGSGLEVSFSAPSDLGGLGLGTNPEELLAAASSACFLITFAATCQFQKINYARVTNRTEVQADNDKGKLRILAINHFPVVYVSESNPEDLKKVEGALGRAESMCMVSQALQPNVRLNVKAKVEVS